MYDSKESAALEVAERPLSGGQGRGRGVGGAKARRRAGGRSRHGCRAAGTDRVLAVLARERAVAYQASGPGSPAGDGAGATSAVPLSEALEGLEAALDRLAAVELSSEDDRAVLDAAVRCQRLANRQAGSGLGLLDEIVRRQAYEADGAVTAASWFRNRVGMDPGEAARRVKAATRLGRLPALAQALAAGDVTLAHVTAVTDAAVPRRMDAIAQFDGLLAELAARAQPRDVRAALHRIRDAADPDGSDTPPLTNAGPDERRHLALDRTIDGLWRLDAFLDPLCGETLATVLEAYHTHDPADTPPDQRRSAGQQRHDALAAALRDLLDNGDTPTVAGNKPHLLAIVDIAALLGHDPGPPGQEPTGTHPASKRSAATETTATAATNGNAPRPAWPRPQTIRQPRLRFGSHITGDQARALARDAKITAVLTMGPWRAVSVGRTMRTLPAWLRPISEMIHRHCRGPDCDRPAVWTEAHHQHAWAEGGHTDLNATIPLCHAHHDLVTSKGWHATFDPDTGICTWNGPQGQHIRTPAPEP